MAKRIEIYDKNPKLKPIQATRTLRHASGPGKRSVIRLGIPYRRVGNWWACAYHISGIGMKLPLAMYGTDPFQALIGALEIIRVRLDISGVEFEGYTTERGDTGFPHYINSVLGIRFNRRLERMVETEIRKATLIVNRRAKRGQKWRPYLPLKQPTAPVRSKRKKTRAKRR